MRRSAECGVRNEGCRDPLAVSQPACLSTGILVADHLCSPIHHMPRAGELLLADELPLALGGCAANQQRANRCEAPSPLGRMTMNGVRSAAREPGLNDQFSKLPRISSNRASRNRASNVCSSFG